MIRYGPAGVGRRERLPASSAAARRRLQARDAREPVFDADYVLVVHVLERQRGQRVVVDVEQRAPSVRVLGGDDVGEAVEGGMDEGGGRGGGGRADGRGGVEHGRPRCGVPRQRCGGVDVGSHVDARQHLFDIAVVLGDGPGEAHGRHVDLGEVVDGEGARELGADTLLDGVQVKLRDCFGGGVGGAKAARCVRHPGAVLVSAAETRG